MAVANACILYPVRFAATSYDIEVTVAATTETVTLSGLTVGRNYWLSADAQADASTDGGPGDLLELLKTAIESHSEAPTVTMSVSATNVVSITVSSATTLKWSHANTTLDPTIFGWADLDVVDNSGVLTAPNQSQGAWCPARPFTEDSRDRTPYTISSGTTMDGTRRVSRLAAGKDEREVSWTMFAKELALSEYETATEPFGAWQTAWDSAISKGWRFRVYDDATSRTSSSYGLYALRMGDDPLKRNKRYRVRWDLELNTARAED